MPFIVSYTFMQNAIQIKIRQKASSVFYDIVEFLE